jgi:hypothetical protein
VGSPVQPLSRAGLGLPQAAAQPLTGGHGSRLALALRANRRGKLCGRRADAVQTFDVAGEAPRPPSGNAAKLAAADAREGVADCHGGSRIRDKGPESWICSQCVPSRRDNHFDFLRRNFQPSRYRTEFSRSFSTELLKIDASYEKFQVSTTHPTAVPCLVRSASDKPQRQWTSVSRHSDIKLERSLESIAVSAAAMTISGPLGPSAVRAQSPEGPRPPSTTRNNTRRMFTACRAARGP